MNGPSPRLLMLLVGTLLAASCSRSEMGPPIEEPTVSTPSSSGLADHGGSKGAPPRASVMQELEERDRTVSGASTTTRPEEQAQPVGGTVSLGGEARGPGSGDLPYADAAKGEPTPERGRLAEMARKEAVFHALEAKPTDANAFGAMAGEGQAGLGRDGRDGDGLIDGKLEEPPPPPDDSGLKDSLESALAHGWRDGGKDLGNAERRLDDDQARDGFEPNEPEVAAKEKPKEVADKLDARDEEREVAANEPDEKTTVEAARAKAGKHGNGLDDLRGAARGTYTLRASGEDPALFVPPKTTLPRMFYFENTYLGGSAAYAERLRRLEAALGAEARPYELVRAEAQPFDLPRTEGLAVSASVDASHFERARRVFLQVGLQGSARYGWRRPPLDVVLVLDRPALDRGLDAVTDFVVELLRTLGPSDRIGVVVAGSAAPFLEITRLTSAQQHLAHRIDALEATGAVGALSLADAMRKAGAMLTAASDDEATVPGSKTVLVLTGDPSDLNRIAASTSAAHELTVQGAVTSVFALGGEAGEWWQVANAGYGNLHRLGEPSDPKTRARAFADAISEELSSIARVVARLVRVNIRLGKDTRAIRVLGTRVLQQREVEDVKARELATDRNLSKSLGIVSDRGEDDDGIQTVIPYFYGDDSHVILIELWVEGPGIVADVTVRYKDMVNLDNATARTSVRLGTRPQPPTREQLLVAKNARGFELAESLQAASDAVYRNDYGAAWGNLGAAAAAASETNVEDARAVTTLRSLIEQRDWQGDAARRATLTETLLISGQRRVGDTGAAARKR